MKHNLALVIGGLLALTFTTKPLAATLEDDALKEAIEACDEGKAVECYSLAQHMHQTKATSEALVPAIKSCKLGFASGCHLTVQVQMQLGQLAEALKTAQAACATLDDQGESCFWLAQIAGERGISSQASLWLERSCKLGHRKACEKLDKRKEKTP